MQQRDIISQRPAQGRRLGSSSCGAAVYIFAWDWFDFSAEYSSPACSPFDEKHMRDYPPVRELDELSWVA